MYLGEFSRTIFSKGTVVNNTKRLSPIRCLDMTIKTCLVGMMIAIASLTFYQVVMRYGFNRSSSWSEEAIRFIFIWCSFLAIAIGVREKIHIGISIFVDLFNSRVQRAMELIGYLAIMVFSAHLVYYGWKVVIATNKQTSPALEIPMSLIYLSVPTMGSLILIYSANEILSIKNRPGRTRKGQ